MVEVVEGVGSHASWTALLLMPSILWGWPLLASNLLLQLRFYLDGPFWPAICFMLPQQLLGVWVAAWICTLNGSELSITLNKHHAPRIKDKKRKLVLIACHLEYLHSPSGHSRMDRLQ